MLSKGKVFKLKNAAIIIRKSEASMKEKSCTKTMTNPKVTTVSAKSQEKAAVRLSRWNEQQVEPLYLCPDKKDCL